MRETFGLFTLELAEFVKGFVEASRNKIYQLKTQSDAGFANAIVFVVKLEKPQGAQNHNSILEAKL